MMTTHIPPSDLRQIKAKFGIVGHSPKLHYALSAALQVAKTEMTVLIRGDSGTGKESFSKIIHALSARKHDPFVPVNCGAIPEGTVDSELFGHERGAFTGATDMRKGYFEYADKGTIFLDEVAELPFSAQARLLRILEYGEFMRVGSSKAQRVDVRVIAATNVDLQERFSQGKFREDLYYRLSTVPIAVPSLRERKEDIPLLFKKFAADYAEKYKTTTIFLSPEAEQCLVDYHFSGNIRQLKNLVEQMSVLSFNREISEEILQKYLPKTPKNTFMVLEKEGFSKLSDREILYKILLEMRYDVNQLKALTYKLLRKEETPSLLGDHDRLFGKRGKAVGGEYVPTLSGEGQELPHSDREQVAIGLPVNYEIKEVETKDFSMKGLEKEAIMRALERHKKKKEVAAQLGISERTLYRKLREYAIPS